MRRLYLFFGGIILLVSAVLLWANEDNIKQIGKRNEIFKSETFEGQMKYVLRNSMELSINYLASKKYLNKRIDRILGSYDYIHERFSDELNNDIDLGHELYRTVTGIYYHDFKDYKRAWEIYKKHEKYIKRNKEKLTEKEYKEYQWKLQETKANLYMFEGKYKKSIRECLKIIDLMPYRTRSEAIKENLWVSTYQKIARRYINGLNDYENAMKYYKKMAIDPRKLPAEKIGWVDHGSLPTVNWESEYETNKRDSFYQQTRLAEETGHYKDYQELLLDIIKEKYEKFGAVYLGSEYGDLVKSWQDHGKYVEFNPIRVVSDIGKKRRVETYHSNNGYTVVTLSTQYIGFNEMLFNEDGSVTILTESIKERIDKQNENRRKAGFKTTVPMPDLTMEIGHYKR